MRKSLFTVCFLWLSVMVHAQTQDAVVMTVAGEDVSLAEFEYFYNKNNTALPQAQKKAIEEYAEMFVNYRLKVKAAKEARLDTLTSFREEFGRYRDKQLLPYLKDEEYVDSVARVSYAELKERVGDSDLISVAHIMMALPQRLDKESEQAKKQRIDSIYQALKGGADFAEMAKKYSEDYSSALKGGELPWIVPNQTLKEFEDAAYKLQKGEMSEPVETPIGYHIILMKERKKLESYEEKRAEIVAYLMDRGLRESVAIHMFDRMVREAKGTLTREDVAKQIQKEASKTNATLDYLIKEYYDGLLLYEICDREVWQKAAADESGSEDYFKKNKKKYRWDAPHFKGFIVAAKSKDLLAKSEKILKKYKDRKGIEALKNKLQKDSQKSVKARFVIFAEGEDAMTDYLKFGKEVPEGINLYPHCKAIGKMLKKPTSYEDVKADVKSDYQEYYEQQWVMNLRKKYKYTINKEVLKTVNNHQ